MSYGTTKWRDWVLNEDASFPFYGQALDAGINFFDTANVYASGESEVQLAKALGSRRRDIVVATKVFGRIGEGANEVGLSRLHILRQAEEILKRLNALPPLPTDWQPADPRQRARYRQLQQRQRS